MATIAWFGRCPADGTWDWSKWCIITRSGRPRYGNPTHRLSWRGRQWASHVECSLYGESAGARHWRSRRKYFRSATASGRLERAVTMTWRERCRKTGAVRGRGRRRRRRPCPGGRRDVCPGPSSAPPSRRPGRPTGAGRGSAAASGVVDRSRCVGSACRKSPSGDRVKSSPMQLPQPPPPPPPMTTSSTSSHNFRFRIIRWRRSSFSSRRASFVAGASRLSHGHILSCLHFRTVIILPWLRRY